MTDEMKAKRELLFSGSKNGYDRVDQQTLDAMEAYCRAYKSFLDNSKTERECTAHTVALAEAAGFIPYERGMALQPGDRVYRCLLYTSAAPDAGASGGGHRDRHGSLRPDPLSGGDVASHGGGHHQHRGCPH